MTTRRQGALDGYTIRPSAQAPHSGAPGGPGAQTAVSLHAIAEHLAFVRYAASAQANAVTAQAAILYRHARAVEHQRVGKHLEALLQPEFALRHAPDARRASQNDVQKKLAPDHAGATPLEGFIRLPLGNRVGVDDDTAARLEREELSQVQLAELLGITRPRLSLLRNRHTEAFSVKALVRLAAGTVLTVSVSLTRTYNHDKD